MDHFTQLFRMENSQYKKTGGIKLRKCLLVVMQTKTNVFFVE